MTSSDEKTVQCSIKGELTTHVKEFVGKIGIRQLFSLERSVYGSTINNIDTFFLHYSSECHITSVFYLYEN